MADTIMLLVTHVDDSIIGAKTVRMNGRRQLDLATNNGLNTSLFAVRDDFRIDTAITFIDAEDDCFTSCSTSALAAHASSAEVRFIQLDITGKRRLALTIKCNG